MGAAVLVATLAGCGTTVAAGPRAAGPNGGEQLSAQGNATGTAPAGGDASAATGSAASAAGGLDGNGSAAGPAGAATGPGAVAARPANVHLSPIKVGFLAVQPSSATSTYQLYGASFLDQGDPADEMKALTAYVNAHGGIAGHPMKSVLVYRQTSDGDAEDDAHCTQLTQDEKVFAVITNGSPNTACYAKAHTLLLADEAYTGTQLREGAPYVWDIGLPFQEAGYAAEVDALAGQGFFPQGVKVGVVAFDRPDIHTVYDKTVLPRIRRYFNGLVDPVYIGFDSNQAVAEGASNAELRFAGEGVTKVFFMAPGGSAPLSFMQVARSQGYHPQYGISTYDVPLLLTAAKQADQMAGSIGAGFDEAIDLTDTQNADPYPTGVAEKRCRAAMAAVYTPNARGGSTQMGYFCDGAFFLQAAAALVSGALTREAIGAAADRLGSVFQSAWTLPGTTEFRPGRHSGAAAYRFMKYDTSCQCYGYVGGNRRMDV